MKFLKRKIKIVELRIEVGCSDHIHKDWIFEDEEQNQGYIIAFPVRDYYEIFDE